LALRNSLHPSIATAGGPPPPPKCGRLLPSHQFWVTAIHGFSRPTEFLGRGRGSGGRVARQIAPRKGPPGLRMLFVPLIGLYRGESRWLKGSPRRQAQPRPPPRHWESKRRIGGPLKCEKTNGENFESPGAPLQIGRQGKLPPPEPPWGWRGGSLGAGPRANSRSQAKGRGG